MIYKTQAHIFEKKKGVMAKPTLRDSRQVKARIKYCE
jgi:hypothetical protein